MFFSRIFSRIFSAHIFFKKNPEASLQMFSSKIFSPEVSLQMLSSHILLQTFIFSKFFSDNILKRSFSAYVDLLGPWFFSRPVRPVPTPDVWSSVIPAEWSSLRLGFLSVFETDSLSVFGNGPRVPGLKTVSLPVKNQFFLLCLWNWFKNVFENDLPAIWKSSSLRVSLRTDDPLKISVKRIFQPMICTYYLSLNFQPLKHKCFGTT